MTPTGAETDIPLLLIVFWGLLTFSLIVVVHELGHFLTAKAFGVKVHEFVVGLPGPMLRLRGKSTDFGITAVPLGGYVKIAGMEPGPEDPMLPDAFRLVVERGETDVSALAGSLDVGIGRARSLLATLTDYAAIEPADDDGHAYRLAIEVTADPDALLEQVRSHTYRGKKVWQRIVILGTGVFLNLVFAILTFTLVLSLYGYLAPSTTIERVEDGFAADRVGIRAGDVVVSLDGIDVQEWEEVQAAIGAHEPGDVLAVEVDRQGRSLSFDPVLGDQYDGVPTLGIESRFENVKMPPFTALRESIRWTGLVFEALGNLFNPDRFGSTLEDARGIVGVSVEAARAAERGPIDYAWMLALLSLSLGALNIFPIPPLDGGKIALEIVGKVTGRPVGREVYLGLTILGALAIFSLLGYLVYADFVRYVFSG